MKNRLRCALFVWLLTGTTIGLMAQPNIDEKIAQQQIAADEATARRVDGEPAIKATRAKAAELTSLVTTLKIQQNKSESTIKNEESKLPKLQEAVKKAVEERITLETESAAASKLAGEARGKENERAEADKAKMAAEKVVTATKTLAEALKAVQPVESTIAETRAAGESLPEKGKSAEQAVVDFQPELQRMEALYAALSTEAVARQIELETSLVAVGRLVSFAKQVAPIFSDRCLACHNVRTSKGRLNMETYAGLMKGGESGLAIVAATPNDSLLQTVIEDHSMPQDADPLSDDQIAIIKKWIETGAQLDAGISGNAQLIAFIPKPTQPAPPETYRVPVPVMALAFSPDGTLLATSGYREVLLWNTTNGQLVRRIANIGERPHDIAFSADGKMMAVAAGTPGQMGDVKLFNSDDGTLLADLFTTDDEVFAVAFSPDGTRLAAACADRSVRLFNVATRRQEKRIEDHADWVMDVAWSPDGKKIATASRDKTSKIFDSTTGESQITSNGHGQPVFGVGFLPDGNTVATSGRDKKIRLWNVTDAKQTREIVVDGEVFRIVITADGLVLSGSADKIARQHKLADGVLVKQYGPHNDWVYAIAYDANSKRVASGSHDGEVRIWNAEDGKELLKFTAAPGYKPQIAAVK